MGPIEPEHDRRQKCRPQIRQPSIDSREWEWVAGLVRGGWVYEHRDGARAYLHANDDGELEVATWDPVNDRHFPDLEALQTIAAEDLRSLRESDHPDAEAWFLLSGIPRNAALKSHRGRKRNVTSDQLPRFADEFLRIGDRWSAEHEKWACSQWNLGRRQVLEVLRRAEERGLLLIAKSGGVNRYARPTDTSPAEEAPSSPERAEWHRRSLRRMEAARANLNRAHGHSEADKPPSSRELSDCPEILGQLAEDDDSRCRRTFHGYRCALRVGHSGGCFVWTRNRKAAA